MYFVLGISSLLTILVIGITYVLFTWRGGQAASLNKGMPLMEKPLREIPLIERACHDAPGDFYTTGECLACGVPESLAPECLAPLDEHNSDTHFLRQPATPEEVERVCQAAESCCVDALRYRGSDPAIRARLGRAFCD
jgi:ferredoxin